VFHYQFFTDSEYVLFTLCNLCTYHSLAHFVVVADHVQIMFFFIRIMLFFILNICTALSADSCMDYCSMLFAVLKSLLTYVV